MSNVYNIEPPTQGKVVLQTTKGDIDIELWAKEAPKAVRNFVQLCLEGFYDNSPFHRILKGELVQGGDPTGEGSHSESIFGEPFKDEYHSRLRFSHRGIVACAGEQRPHSNGSQFFMTLEAASWLDRKHTIFGKVAGDTVFNLAAIGELETDDQDRPHDVPMLLSTEVVWNPFEDIVPRTTAAERQEAAAAAAAKAKAELKKKAKKNVKLMSFEEEGGDDAAPASSRVRSAHDSIQDRRFVQENTDAAAELARQDELDAAERQKAKAAVRAALSKRTEDAQPAAERHPPGNLGPDDDDADDVDGDDFEARMRASAMAKRKAFGRAEPAALKAAAVADTRPPKHSDDGDEDDDDDEERPNKRPNVSRLSSTMRDTGKLFAATRPGQVRVENAELLTDSQRKFKESKQRNRMTKDRDASNLERLKAFRASLAANSRSSFAAPARAQQGNAGDDAEPGPSAEPEGAWRIEDYLAAEDEVDISELQGHKLKFAVGRPGDSMSRSENVDDYVVIDPRVAAQKDKLSKGQLRSLKQDGERPRKH